jgi:transcriptional regulator with XRE-family HTH domain
MNEKIIQLLKNIIECKGIKYTFLAEKSGIEYQRLMRIFNQKATISGSELICLSRILEVEQATLMKLLDSTV